MSLIDRIKADALAARKARDTLRASLLVTLTGEAERVGKDNGNRAPTDQEVTDIILKFNKNLGEVIKVRPSDAQALAERAVLESYLPQRITGEALVAAVKAVIAQLGLATVTGKDMGAIMKGLSAAHPNAYDGKEASEAVRAQVNAG
jgi:uncharacterized protein